MTEDPTIVGLFDTKLMRPACVLLQAVGGDRRVSTMFPTESWLTAPTPDMKLISAPLSQWRQVRDRLHPGSKGG